MDAHKLQLKLFAEPAAGLELEGFIPVFHDWIKHERLGELLIDVANYAHVPQGPGVVLIGHGADYFMDESEGRLGLLYNRKRDTPEPGARLADTFRRAIHAALLLEQESALGGKLRFRTHEWLFRINDRLAAPNGEATLAAVKPELEAFCRHLFQGGDTGHELQRVGTSRQLFAVRISTPGAPGLAALLDRLGGPPPAVVKAA
jgi:hypothetical protein